MDLTAAGRASAHGERALHLLRAQGLRYRDGGRWHLEITLRQH
jgi:hypothetical protein